MKIAIDINDVLRNFSENFLNFYVERYNHEFDLEDFEYWTNNMQLLFPFQSENAYWRFVYEDFVFELFGKCSVCERGLEAKFNKWVTKTLPNLDLEEPIDLIIVSTSEYGESIAQTQFFLSKIGNKVRETYFPVNIQDIWDRCDVLVTANPNLLNSKPEGKTSIKIRREYNTDEASDYNYGNLSAFLKDNNIIKTILNGE